MSVYFYVIEWHDGSGKTSGTIEMLNPHDALAEVKMSTCREVKDGLYGATGVKKSVGDVITFNKVAD